jgi:hypothetical protein
MALPASMAPPPLEFEDILICNPAAFKQDSGKLWPNIDAIQSGNLCCTITAQMKS